MWVSNQVNTFNYLGSKYSILQWLYQYLPYTKSWVELFGGSGVVTMNRRPSPIETYNDNNLQVVNFFAQLRDNPDELLRLLHLTPHSRFEYDEAWFMDADNDIERARKFFIRVRQSFFATGVCSRTKGFMSSKKDSRHGMAQSTHKYLNSVEALYDVVERFKKVQLENKDFEYLINMYDTPETTFYADPPYDEEKTSGTNQYAHPFTQDDHIRLHERAKQVKGKIAISGYDSNYMLNLYDDFYFIPGPAPKNANRKTAARECLWTNYDPATVKGTTLFG